MSDSRPIYDFRTNGGRLANLEEYEPDPIKRMNWKSTWILENRHPYDPLAQYILRCRKGGYYPCDMRLKPILDLSDDYEL